MSDLENESPLEYCDSANMLEEDTNPVVENDYADYITEDLSAYAQRTISFVKNSAIKLRNAVGKANLFTRHSLPPIKSIVGNKGYADIHQIQVPTMPGFTGTYAQLANVLENYKQLLYTIEEYDMRPTLLYLEKLLSDTNLLNSRAPSIDFNRPRIYRYKPIEFKELRDDIAELFTAHDNISMRSYGSVFGNLEEFNSTAKRIGDLYQVYVSSGSINKILELADRIDATGQKLYFKYFSDPKQKVAKEVRKEVATLIRECAIASETLAFYTHIVILANTSFDNITKHLKSKIK
jgi:hypothetical protein